jgi:predicted amidohydrolase YtcJ
MMHLRFHRLLIAAAWLSASACSSRQKLDLLVTHGVIYTLDSAFSVQEAMGIRNGRIVATGTTTGLLAAYRADSVLDLEGRAVYPGFIDAHCHFFGYGCDLVKADFTGTTSYAEVLRRLVDYSATNRFPWLLGRGWDQNDWADPTYPTRKELDSLFPDTPVFLMRIDGHAALCNGAALELAGITASTTVSGGEILRKNGRPTGLLIDNAMTLVQSLVPPFTGQEFRQALLKAQANCFAAGLTTVCDAGLGLDSIFLIDQMQQQGELKMRVYAMVSDVDTNIRYFLRHGPYRSERLSVQSFKLYADGALGSRGACLKAPYSDAPGHYGFMIHDTAHLADLARKAAAHGFQLNTHCIGDSAVHTLLKIYARFLKGKNDRRWRIEHCQVTDPEDLHYFTAYSIIPSVQPTHATSDMHWAGERLGKDRIASAYAYNDLMQAANGMIAFGTDFPV